MRQVGPRYDVDRKVPEAPDVRGGPRLLVLWDEERQGGVQAGERVLPFRGPALHRLGAVHAPPVAVSDVEFREVLREPPRQSTSAGGDPGLDAEARRPDDHFDTRAPRAWPAGVEELLDVGVGRLSRRLVQCGDHAVVPLRKRRHNDEPFRGEEELHLVIGQRPTHAHVGQHEGLGVALALKWYAERSPYEAVPAVAADDVASPYPPLFLRTPHDQLDSPFVLTESDRFVLPKDPPALLAERP